MIKSAIQVNTLNYITLHLYLPHVFTSPEPDGSPPQNFGLGDYPSKIYGGSSVREGVGTTVGGTHVDMPQKHSNFEIDKIIQNINIFRELFNRGKMKKTADVKNKLLQFI